MDRKIVECVLEKAKANKFNKMLIRHIGEGEIIVDFTDFYVKIVTLSKSAYIHFRNKYYSVSDIEHSLGVLKAFEGCLKNE